MRIFFRDLFQKHKKPFLYLANLYIDHQYDFKCVDFVTITSAFGISETHNLK